METNKRPEKLDTTIKRADLILKKYEIRKQKLSIKQEEDELLIRKIDCLSWLLQGTQTTESAFPGADQSIVGILVGENREIVETKLMELIEKL